VTASDHTPESVTDHQVKCFNPNCDAIFDTVDEMVAVQGRGERSPRHFCDDCFEMIRDDAADRSEVGRWFR